MTSLVITLHRAHRPSGGAPLRNWQNIQALRRLGPVDVVSLGLGPSDGPEVVDGIREWIPFPVETGRWARARAAAWMLRPGVFPGADQVWSTRVASWLDQRMTAMRYDVVVVEGLSVATYAPRLKRAGCRLVFDAHNVESVLHESVMRSLHGSSPGAVRRSKNALLQSRILSVEGRAIAAADVVWTCSAEDVVHVQSVYGRTAGVAVVPNGVDVERYRSETTSRADADWSGLPVTLVYPGSFDYVPNEDAAVRLIREVLPAVRARGAAVRLVLIGRSPTAAMREAAGSDPAVEITGSVSDIVPHLRQPGIITLPIALGGGTRLKILEAAAIGRPIVSTAKGAEGIEAVDGEHLLLRETPDSIADAAVGLWHRPDLRGHLCERALALVRARYSWPAVAEAVARSLGTSLPQASVLDAASASSGSSDMHRSSQAGRR